LWNISQSKAQKGAERVVRFLNFISKIKGIAMLIRLLFRTNRLTLTVAVLLIGSLLCRGQEEVRAEKQEKQDNQQYGYCLQNVSMTPEQKARIDKLMVEQQDKMEALRVKIRSTRNWEEKERIREEMDALVASHQKQVWAIVPEAMTQAGAGSYSRPAGRGYYCCPKGYGRGGGKGYGRGRFGRGAGRGYYCRGYNR
jgi:hypothetical protein